MMRSNARAMKFVSLGSLAVLLTACSGNNGLPSTVTIELPDGTAVQTTLGSGVISFADSRWQFFRTTATGQGAPFATIIFGPNGELASIEDNTIAAEIFGTTLLFDGAIHPTSQPGLTYAAATFGAATSDSMGFAFEGRITAFAVIIGEAANATMTASGSFDGSDIDTVKGTFTFSSRVTALDIPEGNLDDSFAYIGRRITE